jgi:hypothetical protein
MNKQNHFQHAFCHSAIEIGRFTLVLGIVLGTSIMTVHAEGKATSAYQQNMLFNPSQSLLKAESRGRVTIYDGLANSKVERALDTQFGRIDNMMFISTRHTLEDGTVEEDDDCD